MAKLTLKEFMSELNTRLEKSTHEELKEIIISRGMNLPPHERQEYLDQLIPPKKSEKKNIFRNPSLKNGESLLRDIQAFGKRAANYEYTTGWGWDDRIREERAWGDDRWVGEIDSLFERINDFYEAGEYALARKAYKELFEIYLIGNEESHFSGYNHDEMISTDLEETALKYLRCVYLTEKSLSRPEALLGAIKNLSYLSSNLNIHGMIHVSLEDLPELDQFGKQWIDYLEKQRGDRIVTDLLREAVRLFEGIKGLEKLAIEKGHQFPGSFVDWLDSLKKEKNYKDMIRVASMGLETLSDRLAIRAKIADYLYEAANQLKEEKLIENSLKEALYASPSLSRLLNLLDHAKSLGQRIEFLNEALTRFKKIKKRKNKSARPSWDFNMSSDLLENYLPENLEMYCHLLKGDYSKVVSLMSPSVSLGWSSGSVPNAFAVPFFLYARWKHDKSLTANMDDLWKETVDISLHAYDNWEEHKASTGLAQRSRTYFENILREFPIPEKDLEEYFLTAEKISLKRVDAIVGEKHRKSYWKAAQLLFAISEVYWSLGEEKKGQNLINRYKEKYNRHSAFKAELEGAAKKSKLFSV